MRKPFLSIASAAVLSLPGFAAAQSAAPASPHTLTANVGLYSQYIFRGLTQTNEDPAIQGGFDYSHSSGVYLGVWGSNISWLKENASTPGNVAGQYSSGGSLELDIYGGFKNAIGNTGLTYDVGLLQYWYPGDQVSGGIDADTLELYGALGWKWFSVKYSYVLSNDAFGVKDADGTGYWDFGVSVPVGETGLTLGAHYGIQKFRGSDNRNVGGAGNDELYSYDDWRVSVAYDLGKASSLFNGAEIGLMYTDTSSADTCGYGKTSRVGSANGTPCNGPFPKDISDSQVTAWFKKTF